MKIIDDSGDLMAVGFFGTVFAAALIFVSVASYRWASSPTYQEQICENTMYGESKGPGVCYDALVDRKTGKILSTRIVKDTAR